MSAARDDQPIVDEHKKVDQLTPSAAVLQMDVRLRAVDHPDARLLDAEHVGDGLHQRTEKARALHVLKW
jgi:hypothetical protein